MNISDFALIVFDLDGTLVDSRADLAGAANATLASYDAPPLSTEAIVGLIGHGARTLVARVLDAAEIAVPDADAALERFMEIYARGVLDETTTYPGVEDVLCALARIPKAVLTNKPEALAHRVVSGLRLDRHFAEVWGGVPGRALKPDPAPLRQLARRHDADLARVLVVGDGPPDIAVARAAGARSCAALYGFTPAALLLAERPDAAVARFAELPAIRVPDQRK